MSISDAAKSVVRRNTEEVQGQGKFEVFEELFADDFVDHTTQPGTTPDKAGVRKLYTYMRKAFPDFHAKIHWQIVDGYRVTTYKTYYGTHDGPFLGIAPTHRKIHFESVDVMRVQNGKITDHRSDAAGRANRSATQFLLCTYRRLQTDSPALTATQ